MTGDQARFRLMCDRELQDVASRLEATVNQLQHAQHEAGLRIRATYQEHLDAARTELARRRA